MEKRAAIPPGIPPSNPTISYWQNPPPSLANHRTTTELPSSTDILIIGSGITGASLAYHLLDQNSPPSVLLLEARTACSGATGRNGGHTKHAAHHEFLENKDSLGEAEAAKIAIFKYNCMRATHTFSKEHGIECDSWQGDTADVFYHQGHFEKAKKAVSEIRRVLGDHPAARYCIWDAEQTHKNFLVEGAIGAVSYEAGSLWPYKFVIGLLELAVTKGLNLQTETPALKLVSAGPRQGWVVQTPRGHIKARTVLLATNGHTAHLWPALQGIVVPLRGHMTAQRPGSGLPRNGLATTYSFIYDDGYEYMISRPQDSVLTGDVMIGGGSTKAPNAGIGEFGNTDDTSIDPVILNYLNDSAQMRFGSNWGDDSPEGRLCNAWTGIMGYSSDGFPMIGKVPGEDGLYISASFQGSGMVLCFDSARALVNIIHENHEKEIEKWFPKSFLITSERMKLEFRGRLHTTVKPMGLEVKSQA